MIDARLGLALQGGGLSLPRDGTIAVFGPPAGAGLAALPADRLQIIEGMKPLHDQWAAHGFDCVVEPRADYAAAIVVLPRAKADARALIAQAVALSGGVIVIDGQKTDGVDSILKDMRKRCEIFGPISKSHGKLFWCVSASADAFADWSAGPKLTEGGFWTAPGVFSADAVDPASALLAAALPEKLGRQVGDLGAGWGFLSAHVLTRPDVEAVHLVESQHIALECARRNVTDPRAQFHWADATTWSPPQKLDSIVMNPPFHRGRVAEPALGQAFMRQAAANLTAQGTLWMVANRHLPYESTLQHYFARVSEIGGDTRFKLFQATRPLRKPNRQA